MVSQEQINRQEREKSSVKSKVEHVLGVIKKKLKFKQREIQRLAKTGSKIEHDVSFGKLDIGYQSFSDGSLI